MMTEFAIRPRKNTMSNKYELLFQKSQTSVSESFEVSEKHTKPEDNLANT